MSNNLIDVGYAKIKKVDTTDPLNPIESYRYVDILIDEENNEIVEPYFFLYDYGQKERTLHYSIPLEGLNHSEVNENTLNILGTQVPSINKMLSYTNSIYLPQIHPSQYVYDSENYTNEPSIMDAPSVDYVATGSEDNSNSDSMGHIYIMLYKYEVSLQLYYRHNVFTDPHFLLNPSGAVPILDTEISLDKSDIELRSIVITLSVDTEDINYSMAIFNDEVETPVKWVVSHPKGLIRALPSINKIKELEVNKVALDDEDNLLSNGFIIGKRNNSSFDLGSIPLMDTTISLSGSSVLLNNKSLSNDQPF